MVLQPLETTGLPESTPSGGSTEAESSPTTGTEEALLVRDLKRGPGGIFTLSETLPDTAEGLYNLSVEAIDGAGNRTILSRNIRLGVAAQKGEVEIIYPLGGEEFFHSFALEGRVHMDPLPEKVTLLVDGLEQETIPLEPDGSFRRVMTAETLTEGEHSLSLSIPGREDLRSREQTLFFHPSGPWVEIASHRTGEEISGRPWLRGRAGWAAPPEMAALEEGKQKKKKNTDPEVSLVEISMDNGRTFLPANGKEEWEFRLETRSYNDENLRLLVRAEFSNGSTAVSRCFLQVDNTPPEVTLLLPQEGARVNESVGLLGEASDKNDLDGVQVVIRKGDKSRYEVPSFIQGLYVDVHALGATYGEIGVGLTFFDDIVKIQGQFGKAPPGRFDGN
ncbi:MAG: hypothetical protein KVP17_002924, partial [Porospora cf. gigantea B]